MLAKQATCWAARRAGGFSGRLTKWLTALEKAEEEVQKMENETLDNTKREQNIVQQLKSSLRGNLMLTARMKTNLKCQLILMGSNPRICKSESKTILSVFQPNTRRKQANQTAKVILPDNYHKALPGLKAVKWTGFHPICQKTVF